ncbi:MAG: hypothetical protein AB8G05_15300 [Oligoflexales bacterium]
MTRPPLNDQKRQIDHMSLEEIVHLANKVGMEYCDAKRKSERLELLKPTQRAKAMEKYDDGKRSEAKIKRLAEVDQEYIRSLEELSEAKSASEKLRLRYESFKNLFEARRSMLSYQKAEMKLL